MSSQDVQEFYDSLYLLVGVIDVGDGQLWAYYGGQGSEFIGYRESDQT